MWQSPYAVARYYQVPLWSQEHLDAMRPLMKMLADAGQKIITATLTHKPWNGQTDVLVEADGSKRLPAKAHAAWEPVLPPERNRTVCVFGASALGQPIQDAAHRPELYASLAEVSPEAVITPAIAARVLAKEGNFDILFINQADVLEDPVAALQPLVYTLPCPAIYGALAEGYWAKL